MISKKAREGVQAKKRQSHFFEDENQHLLFIFKTLIIRKETLLI